MGQTGRAPFSSRTGGEPRHVDVGAAREGRLAAGTFALLCCVNPIERSKGYNGHKRWCDFVFVIGSQTGRQCRWKRRVHPRERKEDHCSEEP